MSNVRVFRAASMPEALALVKNQLGPDAVILGTRTLPANGLRGFVGRERVEITAGLGAAKPGERAAPRAAPAPALSQPRTIVSQRRASEPELPSSIYPYYVELVQKEFSDALAARIAKSAASSATDGSERSIRAALRNAIEQMVPKVGGIRLDSGVARRVALVGPPGGGKTTTIAKLAAHFALRLRKRVVLLSIDTHRLASNDQLRRYAELLGIAAYQAQTVSGIRSTLQQLGEFDVLLIDTPGVAWRERGRFARLAALLRAVKADECHLTLPASLSAAVQSHVARTFEPLGVSRVVLTRLDEAVGLGAVLNVIEQLSAGVSYLSAGQRVPTDLEEAQRERFSELLLSSN